GGLAFGGGAATRGLPGWRGSRLRGLVLYQRVGFDEGAGEPLPTHLRTPAGFCLEVGSAGLKAEIAERFGSDVELMKLKHGIFDETAVSAIALSTIAGIGREAGLDLDPRRFPAHLFPSPR